METNKPAYRQLMTDYLEVFNGRESYKSIGRKYGTSGKQVKRMFDKEGFEHIHFEKTKGKPSDDIVKFLYLRLIKGKESLTSIGKRYGVSANAVKKWFKTAGYKVKLQGKSKTFKCSQCGKEVRREPNAFNKNNRYFCEKKCQNEYSREHKEMCLNHKYR